MYLYDLGSTARTRSPGPPSVRRAPSLNSLYTLKCLKAVFNMYIRVGVAAGPGLLVCPSECSSVSSSPEEDSFLLFSVLVRVSAARRPF